MRRVTSRVLMLILSASIPQYASGMEKWFTQAIKSMSGGLDSAMGVLKPGMADRLKHTPEVPKPPSHPKPNPPLRIRKTSKSAGIHAPKTPVQTKSPASGTQGLGEAFNKALDHIAGAVVASIETSFDQYMGLPEDPAAPKWTTQHPPGSSRPLMIRKGRSRKRETDTTADRKRSSRVPSNRKNPGRAGRLVRNKETRLQRPSVPQARSGPPSVGPSRTQREWLERLLESNTLDQKSKVALHRLDWLHHLLHMLAEDLERSNIQELPRKQPKSDAVGVSGSSHLAGRKDAHIVGPTSQGITLSPKRVRKMADRAMEKAKEKSGERKALKDLLETEDWKTLKGTLDKLKGDGRYRVAFEDLEALEEALRSD